MGDDYWDFWQSLSYIPNIRVCRDPSSKRVLVVSAICFTLPNFLCRGVDKIFAPYMTHVSIDQYATFLGNLTVFILGGRLLLRFSGRSLPYILIHSYLEGPSSEHDLVI